MLSKFWRNLWGVVYPILILVGVQYGMQYGIWYALKTRAAQHMMSTSHIPAEVLQKWLTLIIIASPGIVNLVIFTLLWWRERKKSNINNNKLSILTVVLIVCSGITFSLAASCVISMVSQYFPSHKVVAENISAVSFEFQLMVFCVVAPIVEELCLRGLVLKRLLNWVPAWVAVLVTSFLFGLMHWNPLQGAYTFVMGIALSLLYVRFRNIWAPIIFHMVFNSENIILHHILSPMLSDMPSQISTAAETPSVILTLVVFIIFVTSIALSGLFGWLLSKRPAATVSPTKETQAISPVEQ